MHVSHQPGLDDVPCPGGIHPDRDRWREGRTDLSAYIIAEVAVLPIAGKLIDNHGPRNILTIGAVLFILYALVC